MTLNATKKHKIWIFSNTNYQQTKNNFLHVLIISNDKNLKYLRTLHKNNKKIYTARVFLLILFWFPNLRIIFLPILLQIMKNLKQKKCMLI